MNSFVTALVRTAGDLPQVEYDADTPFLAGIQTIGSYIFTGGLALVLIALVIALVAVVFKGFGNERFQGWGGDNIIRLFIVAACLGAVNAIFAFAVGFDFGF